MARPIHYEDLPLAVRQRIKGARREKVQRVQSEFPSQRLWQCTACGEVSKSWAAAEQHADDHGHRRVELVLARLDDNSEPR